jgi:hypothetical protein
MVGNSTDTYQILFPGALGWELWLVNAGESSLLSSQTAEESIDFDPTIRAIRVLAQPIAFQVALPFVSNATDFKTLVQSAHLHVEKQGQGFDEEGIMVEAVFGTPPSTVARIDAPLSKLNRSGLAISTPDIIVPAATTMPLRRNSIAIWNELGNAVFAFERNGTVIYYDKLGGSSAGFPDEVYRLMVQLEGSQLINKPEVLSLWGEIPRGLFESKLQLKTEYEQRPSPTQISGNNTLRPLWFREDVLRRQSMGRKKRQRFWAVSVLGTLGFILSVFLLTKHFQIRNLKHQIAILKPGFDRIESIKTRWNEVSTGVDPDASFLEIWMNIFNLQSISSIKIESLNINRAEIAIIGNSAGASQALGFIEELTTSELFQTYAWEYQPPAMSAGGFATFEIKGIK